jgi:hypothetical protein
MVNPTKQRRGGAPQGVHRGGTPGSPLKLIGSQLRFKLCETASWQRIVYSALALCFPGLFWPGAANPIRLVEFSTPMILPEATTPERESLHSRLPALTVYKRPMRTSNSA